MTKDKNIEHLIPDEQIQDLLALQIDQLKTGIQTDREGVESLIAEGFEGDPIAELYAEIQEKEMLLGYFYETFDELKRDRQKEEPVDAKQGADRKSVQIDREKIGWLSGDGELNVGLDQLDSKGVSFLFGSIVDEDGVTKGAADKLRASGEWEKLVGTLERDALPALWIRIGKGDRNLRPVSIGTRSPKDVVADNSMNTIYPAYKIDVQGTNNRALIMLVDKIDDQPVFVLAAMYDHDDQQRVLNHTFLKNK